jgi:hypothetical protein
MADLPARTSAPVRDSVERVDQERGREAERRHDPDELAAVLVGLGHHRVREHREDRPRRERENERHGVRRRVLEDGVDPVGVVGQAAGVSWSS